MPQGHRGEGGAKPKTNSRPIERDQPSRSRSPSSHSRAKYTRDIGLLMLVKKSSNLEANNKDLRERNRIMMAAVEGEVVKFQWNNPNTNYEKNIHDLKKGILDPNKILYRSLEDDQWRIWGGGGGGVQGVRTPPLFFFCSEMYVNNIGGENQLIWHFKQSHP